jgi:hypothetical protein
VADLADQVVGVDLVQGERTGRPDRVEPQHPVLAQEMADLLDGAFALRASAPRPRRGRRDPRPAPHHVDWPGLFELKRHWQVSRAALLMRARTLAQ